jgi:hypothetical protein
MNLLNPFILGGGVAFVPDAFDPASATGSYTFSESNRLFNDTNPSNNNSHMRGTKSYSSGKRKIELQSVQNTYASQPAIGLCNSGDRGSYLGSNANAIAWYNTGEIYYNGSILASSLGAGSHVIGGWTALEADLDGGIFTLRFGGGGQIGWVIPSGLIGQNLYFCVGTFAQSDKQRVNCGNAAWNVTTPSGFEQGW